MIQCLCKAGSDALPITFNGKRTLSAVVLFSWVRFGYDLRKTPKKHGCALAERQRQAQEAHQNAENPTKQWGFLLSWVRLGTFLQVFINDGDYFLEFIVPQVAISVQCHCDVGVA